jgi:hypothetical protein
MLDQSLPYCSIFMYETEADAEARAGWGGSGFLVGVNSDTYPELAHIYAVTNAHIVSNHPVIRFRDQVIVKASHEWTRHPDGDDVAVCSLGLKDSRTWTHIGSGLMLDQHTMRSHRIGPGDDCFMVGRFVSGAFQAEQPVVRFGNLAMLPEKIHQAERGIDQESFLVDMRSLPGYSGSPVFLYWTAERVMSWSLPVTSESAVGKRSVVESQWLLGIDWGHVDAERPVRDRTRNPLPDGSYVEMPSGMAAVVPAWKLAGILRDPKMIDSRRQAEEELWRQP